MFHRRTRISDGCVPAKYLPSSQEYWKSRTSFVQHMEKKSTWMPGVKQTERNLCDSEYENIINTINIHAGKMHQTGA
jgi:hypothetical protein